MDDDNDDTRIPTMGDLKRAVEKAVEKAIADALPKAVEQGIADALPKAIQEALTGILRIKGFISQTPSHGDDCSICVSSLDENVIRINKCGHHFHQDCVYYHITKSAQRWSCPLCRCRFLHSKWWAS